MEDTQMSALRLFPTLAAAVCVLGTMACADSSTAPPRFPPATHVPPPAFVTLIGVVHLVDRTESGVILETPDGDEIRLAGGETALLERVDGAEVEVRGTWDADVLAVKDFLVRAVGGIAALDGVVTEMYSDDLEYEFIGYGLRLSPDGALIVPLIDPPDDLIEHVGDRMWVTGAPDGKPTAYGVIRRASEPE
jgi:hypothetical protein